MSFTPLLATAAEVAIVTNHFEAGKDFGLSSTDWDTLRDIVHEAVEAEILTFINWIDMDSDDLSGSATMKAQLKMATLMAVTNQYSALKQQKQGNLIMLNELVAKILDQEILTQRIKDKIRPYRQTSILMVDREDEE